MHAVLPDVWQFETGGGSFLSVKRKDTARTATTKAMSHCSVSKVSFSLFFFIFCYFPFPHCPVSYFQACYSTSSSGGLVHLVIVAANLAHGAHSVIPSLLGILKLWYGQRVGNFTLLDEAEKTQLLGGDSISEDASSFVAHVDSHSFLEVAES